jgi:hypothetical protein
MEILTWQLLFEVLVVLVAVAVDADQCTGLGITCTLSMVGQKLSSASTYLYTVFREAKR